jgi:queuine tRNA-ribosyltransferase
VVAVSELRELELPHGRVTLPAFLPDATAGVVRSLDFQDVLTCGIEAVVMNTFHLMKRPGSSTVEALGGLHQMSGWDGPIVTDSGGFQAYSLIRENLRHGTIDDAGIHFKSPETKRTIHLTPEKCIQLQLRYGSDIVICLDDCTHADDAMERQEASVRRTIAWARRGKEEFVRLVAGRRESAGPRPLLFAVVQGGGSPELREMCATALLDIGFDGFGYGGWPLDGQGNLLDDILRLTRRLIPTHYPMHALGVGHPENVADCYRFGYTMFDSALPTRDARHGRLYRRAGAAAGSSSRFEGRWFSYLYIQDDKHIKVRSPISASCDCLSCAHYSLGYLHHLYKVKDTSFFRLATIHNLRFMAQLMAELRAARGA